MFDKSVTSKDLLAEVEALRRQIRFLENGADEAGDKDQAGPESFLSAISDGVVRLASDLKVIWANKPARQLWAGSGQGLIGATLEDILVAEGDLELGLFLEKTLKEGSSRASARPLNLRTDKERWFEVRVYPEADGLWCLILDITAQKRKEDETIKLRESFQTLTENSPDLIVRADRDLKILYVNPAVEKISGRDSRRIIGLGLRELNVSEDLCTCLEKNSFQVLETAREKIIEFNFSTREGRKFFQMRLAPEVGPDGQVISILGLGRDISSHKQIEAKLRRYQQIIAATRDCMALVSPDYVYQAVNDAYLDTFKLNRDQIVGRFVAEVIGVEAFEKLKRVVDLCLAGKETHFEGWVYMTTMGIKYRETSYYPFREPDGRVTGVVISSRDITERKKTEEALRESEAKYRLLLDHAFEAIIVAQGDYFIYVNPRAEEYSGYTADELTSRPYLDFIHPDDRGHILLDYAQRLKGGKRPRGQNFRLLSKDGRIKLLEVKGVIVDWENKKATINFCTDITEKKAAEEKLAAYQTQLRRLASDLSLTEARERRRLASELHDIIGQTLFAIKMKMDQFYQWTPGPEADEVVNEIISSLKETIDYLRNLIGEMSPPLLSLLGLDSALQSLAERVEREHGLKVTYTRNSIPRNISEDMKDLLYRAVRELMHNVVKHAQADYIMLSVFLTEQTIIIDVVDNGRGFDPVKAFPTTGEDQGFGLFSIRERLNSLGGSLELNSGRGRGARVTLTAPLQFSVKAD